MQKSVVLAVEANGLPRLFSCVGTRCLVELEVRAFVKQGWGILTISYCDLAGTLGFAALRKAGKELHFEGEVLVAMGSVDLEETFIVLPRSYACRTTWVGVIGGLIFAVVSQTAQPNVFFWGTRAQTTLELAQDAQWHYGEQGDYSEVKWGDAQRLVFKPHGVFYDSCPVRQIDTDSFYASVQPAGLQVVLIQ